MTKSLEVPRGHSDSVFVLSVSGGKDSTAMLLLFISAKIPFVAVFADTKWEHPKTYEYLQFLSENLGIEIRRVGSVGGMPAKIAHYAAFPSGGVRWCTRELKIEPIGEFCEKIKKDTGKDVVQVVGVRAEESESRAKMKEFEFDESRDCYVWRPLLEWTTEEIIAIHHKNNIPINPLYKQGFDRVGCFPCIFANKSEIALLNRTEPNRLDELERLEIHVSALRIARGKQGNATFFKKPMREMREWAQTDRGGKQLAMFQETNGGCFRWGFCEPPKKEV